MKEGVLVGVGEAAPVGVGVDPSGGWVIVGVTDTLLPGENGDT